MKRYPTKVRRQQIAEAALRIIVRDGLGHFTTSAISREVGLAEGTIFRHFANKDEILDAAVEHLETRLFPPEVHESTVDDPVAAIERILEAKLEFLKDYPGMLQVLLSNELGRVASKEVQARVRDLRVKTLNSLRKLLDQAARRGRLAEGVSMEAAFVLVQGLLLAMVFSADVTLSVAELPSPGFDEVWSTLRRTLFVD